MRKSVSVCLAVALAVVSGQAQRQVEPPGSARPTPPGKPRIRPLTDAELSGPQRQALAAFPGARQADHGIDTLVHVPALIEAIVPYTLYLLNESTLTPRHRTLLTLRSAWLSGSQVIWADQAPRARAAGLSAADQRRVAVGPSAGWEGIDAAVLRLADELFRNSSVSDPTWTTLAKTFSEHQLMDAVETANHFVVLAMLYNSFGVQPDASTPDRLPADVPYRIDVPARSPALAAARILPMPGDAIAVTRTLARHPKLNAARSRRANFINRVSVLTPRHREMFILRIGWDCQSEYEWAQHVGSVGRAREWGLDPVRIADGPNAPGWTNFERAILRAVDELYRDIMVSDATWAALAAEFDTERMMSGVFTASSYRATSMALNTLGVQLEPGNERFPAGR